jgi:flavin-dependent dehydrogenase
LIESQAFPREHPGETLHPGIEPLLKQLGVFEQIESAGFLRHEGNWIEWNSDYHFEPFGADEHGPWRGYQVWRADFDAILLNRAREVGVKVMQPCRCQNPLVVDEHVEGVQTTNGNVTSSFVIDAAGERHWLARKLKLRIEKHSPPLTARFGYVRGECLTRDEAPAIVADGDGWTWTARVGPNLYQWTRLFLNKERTRVLGVPTEFRELESRGRTQGADVTWRLVTAPAGPGYFLVGDAAAVLDPSSSHGVLKAIMSGMMAAHSIGRIVNGADETMVATAYSRWVADWFEHDASKLTRLYAIFDGETTGFAIPNKAYSE